jgi:hypothetical protein
VLRTISDSRHKREELTEKSRNHYETNMLTRSPCVRSTKLSVY